MKRSRTSKAWMREHLTDPYVQMANKEGYRSRAVYKLMEIDERDHLLKPGMTVVDLGAAPGSWTQVVAKKISSAGLLIALDILPMEPVHGAKFIQGDFREDAVLSQLEAALQGRPVDLVISDMAPNISGIGLSDQARSMHLAELAMEFSCQHLKPGGNFLVKVFQGDGFDDFVREMRARFSQVQVRKPKASRGRSTEVYMLGKGLHGQEKEILPAHK
ncbi:MAG: 23S rRNA (uridine(2552)-2'-O)-methyltransferase RlmE [Sulfurimicrobium sp.]|jgi:23S rRNA (uridine2552-2'-O)-methyltransferase|nr:23S rRNA (uridine(2552)-2'-O)-methyltransferase RlmE [Sulfurimicrobium sp.]MDO9188671.1 23S rRNA (uridine(2552)-2'-O)-methyltransferase RlmE [Sulfurimicrobium sp.]MDP1705054.1 23S rRNA (uridine(2552)-2'-O)-methyltransferase RlmE [Sulfurimicrobium sp.]MDP1898552.1 23S rRNA (uridine(2552)-2'-O)-methyltransferase RlmE [Sulfurimicrobium sp.]MDP2197943.1 23S rRNA (uridine(2552)-2'-O)-methyltransferase RlmE [Sulfurimicrobium sp.]